jgi:hypothetical protein
MNNNDSYASPEEVAALEAQQQEAHTERETWEAYKAGSTGQPYPDDASYGTDAASIRERRISRGWVAREDYEEPTPDVIENYRGPTSADQVRTDEDLYAFSRYLDVIAREKYGPDWDEAFKYVYSELEKEAKDEQELQQQLQRLVLLPGITDRVYQAWEEKNRLRDRLPSQEEINNMDPEQVEALIRAPRSAPVEDRGKSSEAADRRAMKAMNRLSPVAFEAELDRWKQRG